MKRLTTAFLPMMLLIIMAACAPAAVPAAPEVVYNGASADVYAAVVRAVSTSPGIPGSNGWIIDQSDSAGGFVSAQTTTTGYRLIGGTYKDIQSISVVVSPNGDKRTAVVIQFTPKADELAQRVKSTLNEQFGEPVSTTQDDPS